MIIEIAIGFVVLVAIGAIVSPKFRATLQIWNTKANSAATTPLERQKNQYEHLVAAVNAQLGNVAGARAGAIQAEQDVTAAQAEVAKLKGQYVQFKDKAAPATVTALLEKIGKAQDHLKQSQTMAETSHKAAEMANQALDTAREQLAGAADTIQTNEQKAQVTAVLTSAAKVSEDLKGVTSRLGSFNEANRQVDKDFLAAQQRLDMAGGTDADKALADLEKQSRAEEVRKQLEAELAGTTPAAK